MNNQITNLNLNIPITSGMLWFILGVVILIFLIMSAVLIYHWGYYGIKGNKKVIVKSVYFVGSVFLLAMISISLLVFSTT